MKEIGPPSRSIEPLTSQADLAQCDFPPVEWHDQGIEPLKPWACSLAMRSNIKMIMSLIPGELLGLIVNGRKSRVWKYFKITYSENLLFLLIIPWRWGPLENSLISGYIYRSNLLEAELRFRAHMREFSPSMGRMLYCMYILFQSPETYLKSH